MMFPIILLIITGSLLQSTFVESQDSENKKSLCPNKYGSCNLCIKRDGGHVALTRRVCGTYTKGKCAIVLEGSRGTGDNGCNICTCDGSAMGRTERPCRRMKDHMTCISHHPAGNWTCGSSKCTCTNFGFGVYIAE